MSLGNILGKPKHIEGVGNIYPIKMKDYDKFVECSNVLYVGYQHLDAFFESELKNELKLFDILFFIFGQDVIHDLETLFSLVTQKEVVFFSTDRIAGFEVDENHIINRDNYDQVREVIMNQNLLYEPKVFKNKAVQQWAEKVIKTRSKNSVEITVEDMLSTVSAFTGKHYWELEEYTLYQLKSDFERINKLKNYDAEIAFKCAGAQELKIKHFAEKIDLYRNPYDDLFKSKDQFGNKLNQALRG